MNFKFHNKKITGILVIIPEIEKIFEDEIDNYNFSVTQTMKLKSIMGYAKRRVVKEETTISDLCIYGLNHLIQKGYLVKKEIDALVLVTQSPDYFMPPTSHVIHGALELKEDMICMDINQGCSGYVVGLNQALFLLEQDNINKIVLLNADILSKKVSKNDRNINPQIGDAAAITIVEKCPTENYIYSSSKVQGKGAEALIIPAGGFKTPSTTETSILREDKAGNVRSLDHLIMKGDEVFNFVQNEIPPMIDDLLNDAGIEKDTIDYYMFHQPNKFMLKKLADKMRVPHEKMPNNIVENFGNSSGASIPTAIAYNLTEVLKKETQLCCLSGFGVGLSWASMIIHLGPLDFCEIIDYK